MPKIVDHDKYREEMLEKCFHYFSRKGYSNITMREIAVEIGVSTGTLYHYFSTKENMLGELITWAGVKNVREYVSRSSSIENISDRFDLVVDFWKENCEFYQNIMLLAIDMYRNTGKEQWENVYAFFSRHYISNMSERLNISLQFARSIFMYFLGLIFHSLATSGSGDYKEQIDALGAMIKPFIVDASLNSDQVADSIQKIISTMLMNSFVTGKEPVVNDDPNTITKEADKR